MASFLPSVWGESPVHRGGAVTATRQQRVGAPLQEFVRSLGYFYALIKTHTNIGEEGFVLWYELVPKRRGGNVEDVTVFLRTGGINHGADAPFFRLKKGMSLHQWFIFT